VVLDAAGTFDGAECVKVAESRRLGGGAVGTLTGEMEPCPKSMLIKGWGVPTATDISLAWMFALLIFGAGHPAINFLLLLAIVDDALGMIIIAIFYPTKTVEPIWLLLVLGAALLAYGMRRFQVQCWQIYVFIAGPISWLGLIKAHMHPALALVFVVPFMPATHAIRKRGKSDRHIGECDLGPAEDRAMQVLQQMKGLHPKLKRSHAAEAARLLMLYSGDQAPLHVFEHTMKLPVDFGMFFFGLANAGVPFNEFGGITISVVVALAIGKTLGIAAFALMAQCIGFGLPNGVTVTDLFAMSALGGVGLTVALFVANQAFVDPGLRGQAKMGAVISVACAGLGWAIRFFGNRFFHNDTVAEEIIALRCSETLGQEAPNEVLHFDDNFCCTDSEGSQNSKPASDWIDNLLVDEILQIMWTQRQYQARGTVLPTDHFTPRRSSSKRSVGKGDCITDSTPIQDFRRVGSKQSTSSRRSASDLALSSLTGLSGFRRSRPSALNGEFDSACPTPPNSVALASMSKMSLSDKDKEGETEAGPSAPRPSLRGSLGFPANNPFFRSETPRSTAT